MFIPSPCSLCIPRAGCCCVYRIFRNFAPQEPHLSPSVSLFPLVSSSLPILSTTLTGWHTQPPPPVPSLPLPPWLSVTHQFWAVSAGQPCSALLGFKGAAGAMTQTLSVWHTHTDRHVNDAPMGNVRHFWDTLTLLLLVLARNTLMAINVSQCHIPYLCWGTIMVISESVRKMLLCLVFMGLKRLSQSQFGCFHSWSAVTVSS